MAREKKKAERTVEVRPADAAASFSGLEEVEAPPPAVTPPPKGPAKKGGGTAPPPAPAPTPAPRPQAKARPRKESAPAPAPEVVAVVLPAAAPPSPPPAADFSAQAREAAALLESVVQQCREARTQLQRELEEREGVDREVEGLRQRSQEAHERLLRDAQEARELHEKLLAEAKEARVAHQQLLAQAREGAEQVKREQAAAVAQLTAAGRDADKLVEVSRGEHEAFRREIGEGLELLKGQCAAAATQVAETGKVVESLAPKVRGAHEAMLGEEAFAREGAERVKQLCATAAGQLATATEVFGVARESFFDQFERDMFRLQQHVREATEALQDLPRHAEELRARLVGAGYEVRAFEDATAAARQQRDAIEQRLASLRGEVADAEHRLAAVRLELAEADSRKAPEPPPPEPVAQTPPPEPEPEPEPAPKPEPRNHLGITVDPGVVVAEVAPGTPAAAAGLVRGDVVVTVDGTPVLSGPELRDLILERERGDEITLGLMRGGLPAAAKVRFAPGASEENQLGATVESGVVVAEVEAGSPGAVAGLIHGDIITAVNGEEVSTGSQLRDIVHGLASHSEVTLRFTRAGVSREARTQLAEVSEDGDWPL